ncbi:MAG TPA: hypothetical protein VFS39_03595 [Nitrospira sp.]|nr:hypothetical protein [Nitrospira sp.]
MRSRLPLWFGCVTPFEIERARPVARLTQLFQRHTVFPMRLAVLLIIMVSAMPAWAGGESFDPDQPFRQGLTRHFLESLLNHAAEAIEDHLEISGSLHHGDKNAPGSLGALGFRFYPEGKSKSDRHFSAEGWFGRSPDSKEQELHLRFSLPRSSDSSSRLPDNVL